MPSIAERLQHDTKGETDQSPSPKKLKTDKPEYDSANHFHLKWKITNRPDYPPLIRQPYGVTISNVIITAEGLWPHSRLQIFNLNGHSQKVIGQGQILPFDLTMLQDGNIIVTDHKGRTVKAFTQDGDLAYTWEENKFGWPNGIARTQVEHLVVADWSKGRIVRCDLEGREIQSFPTSAGGEDSFSCPDRVMVDAYGRFIVSDGYTSVVKVFSPAGQLLLEIGNRSGSGHLISPKGVAVDRENNILVSDWKQDAIKLYASDGRWIKDLVTSSDSLKDPLAIAWSTEMNSLVVTEHQLRNAPYLKMYSKI